jgi:hypothetical protein
VKEKAEVRVYREPLPEGTTLILRPSSVEEEEIVIQRAA